MSIIIKEFDNNLKKSPIILPLLSSSKSEAGENYNDVNMTDKAQTSVFGIQVPLIMINNTVIDFDAIQYFNLKSKGRLPELSIVVEDKYELISNIDKPTNDNEVRIQILPKFENTYKKIDLTFYITNITIIGTLLRLTCSYKLPSLISSQFKSLGELDTYTLFKNTAIETGLGFATNVSKLNDKRFIYCNNKSLYDLLESEITYSNSSEYILDWWVDLWDNINLSDIKERYNSIDSDDDLKVWISGQVNEVSIDNDIEPQYVPAILTDLPGLSNSELFVTNYIIQNNPGIQIFAGTDKVYSIYDENIDEYCDYLVQDGDTKNDIFTKYEYVGENIGEYNYLLAKSLRPAFFQKMNTETIVITLKSPLIGLMRGHKVNYIRYVNNDIIENKLKNLEEANLIDRNIESNIPLKEYEQNENTDNGRFIIDKTVSGQYLILSTEIIFSNNRWEYILTLTKPASNRTSIIK